MNGGLWVCRLLGKILWQPRHLWPLSCLFNCHLAWLKFKMITWYHNVLRLVCMFDTKKSWIAAMLTVWVQLPVWGLHVNVPWLWKCLMFILFSLRSKYLMSHAPKTRDFLKIYTHIQKLNFLICPCLNYFRATSHHFLKVHAVHLSLQCM